MRGSRLLLLATAGCSVGAEEAGPPGVHVVGALRLAVSAGGKVLSLGPANESNFSFTTPDFGALTVRTRPAGGGGSWGAAQTATAAEGTPLGSLPAGELAASSQPLGADLVAEQHWAAAADAAGGLLLSIKLRNNGSAPLELGLAISMPSNEQTGGNLATLAATASFADPYIGGDHGHLTMTRLTGRGGVLMILGEAGTPLEAFADQWSPLGGAGATGKNAWVVHSRAFAEADWQSSDGGWVNATSATIPAGGTLTRAFRILLAQGGVQQKGAALRAAGRPVLAAVPGYVVATDMTTAKLFVQPPAKATLASATVVNDGQSPSATPCMAVGAPAAPNDKGWVALPLQPTTAHCRCRVELRYSDGSYQVASYYVLPALSDG